MHSTNNIDNDIIKIIKLVTRVITYVVTEEHKMKYTQEIKDQAVKAAQEGKSLKEIQQTIGPNPKATQRYLVKAGIDYKELREQLRADGKLKSSVKKQEKENNNVANAQPATKKREPITSLKKNVTKPVVEMIDE